MIRFVMELESGSMWAGCAPLTELEPHQARAVRAQSGKYIGELLAAGQEVTPRTFVYELFDRGQPLLVSHAINVGEVSET